MTTRGINGTVARPWCKISDDYRLYYLALIIILFEGDVRRRWRSTIRGSRSRIIRGVMMDDDGNNGEDDGDIMIAIDEDEDDLLLQLLRCNFL